MVWGICLLFLVVEETNDWISVFFVGGKVENLRKSRGEEGFFNFLMKLKDLGLLNKNGEINIVEVKCTCPYTDNPNKGGGWRNKGSKSNYGRYSVVDKPHIERIPPYHIPQLQMEILCSGPYCKFLARHTLSNSNSTFKSHYFLTFYNDQCAFSAVPPRTLPL